LSVSASGSASRPPTASGRQASISASTRAGVTRQRAASWTSTQSWSAAPCARSAARPLKTLSARVAPPQAAIETEASGASVSSPADTTTSTRAMRGTAVNAASVWRTIGAPASVWYCLGCAVPARVPVPAQGTSARQRGGGRGEDAAVMRRPRRAA
jgi:hypothetical protein